jgi:tRNA(fMet)-specific endonuclease VapC
METTQLVLDSDIVIDYLRRRSLTLADALRRFQCALTAITVYELQAVPSLTQTQADLLSQLLGQMKVLAFDSTSANHAARVWRTLSTRGQLIGLPDILLAGVCLAYSLPLLTRNIEHFSRVSDLRLITPDELATLHHSE